MGARWNDAAGRWLSSGRVRVTGFVSQPRSGLAFLAAWVLLLALGLVVGAFLLAAMVIAVPIALVLLLVGRARALLARARAPNGVLDGRRNVRVIVRDSA